MAFASILSRAQIGVDAPQVVVEVQLAGGLPTLNMVGLPTTAVRESKDRVRAALKSCGFDFPARRITVNLAPADLPKDGARFDLAIALGILAASGQIKPDFLSNCEVYGELSLSGELRPVPGLLPALLACARANRRPILSQANAEEAALADVCGSAACRTLNDVLDVLTGGPVKGAAGTDATKPPRRPETRAPTAKHDAQPDLADVRGQARARRALEIAAVGQHGLLMIGPPGCGKTLLARRLPGLLPSLTESEALEVACIASVSRQGFQVQDWGQRPFRSPHHSLTLAAMAGGGACPTPGEVTLAHHGVLFLDELPEFRRETLEVLREPMESGTIEIARARHRVRYPAAFQLISAMNPCPCGYLGNPDRDCRCTLEQVARYSGRVSGPLMDRIDMHLRVTPVPVTELIADPDEGRQPESTASVRQRVLTAREYGVSRSGADERSKDASKLLSDAATQLGMTARGVGKTLRVARSIADLAESDRTEVHHLAEALMYRADQKR